MPTIGCTKSRHDDVAAGLLVQQAFFLTESLDLNHPSIPMGCQVINVPAQRFVLLEVASKSGFEITFSTSCVDVVTSRESEATEAADGDGDGSGEVDVELVGR